MKPGSTRLFFIDTMRAWAILMMLQGHFIDGLLDPIFRDVENSVFLVWRYFRGITAPVFFTVSGFIFTYLLVRSKEKGFDNPRVKKGIQRGLQLLLIGYLLRLNLFGLFSGEIYDSFYLVDVLHCIGLSILTIISIYVLASKYKSSLLPVIFLSITLLLFLFEPLYKQWSFDFLPTSLANYFTKANGSVFTIIPWLGYATIGAFFSLLFTKYQAHKNLYKYAIGISLLGGICLVFFSSDFFIATYEATGIEMFRMIEQNNYLFIRLGDVLLVFSMFMVFRKFLTNNIILKIGSNTLSIYVIHFIVLYGSFTGLGLYGFLHHQLNPMTVVFGALAFMILCTFLALQYDKKEESIKGAIRFGFRYLRIRGYLILKTLNPVLKALGFRIKMILVRLFALSK